MIDRTHFLRLSETAVMVSGHRLTLSGISVVVLGWCVVGMGTGFPTEWFMLSNTAATSCALFLLLLMQHSQNRDMRALQTKLDELIRASNAKNHWIGVERRELHELDQMIADGQ